MTPYNYLDSVKKQNFNNSLCRARVSIEQTFGILKRRFPCLSQGMRMSPEKAAIITIACVVLHNIAIDRKENNDEPLDDMDDNFPGNVMDFDNRDGIRIRKYITNTYF